MWIPTRNSCGPAEWAFNGWIATTFNPYFLTLFSLSPQHTPQANRHTAVCAWQLPTHFIVQWFWKGMECNSSLETFGKIILFMTSLFIPEWYLKVTFLPAVSNFPKLNTVIFVFDRHSCVCYQGQTHLHNTLCSFLYWDLFLEPSFMGKKSQILRAVNSWIPHCVVKRANSFLSNRRNISLAKVLAVKQMRSPSTSVSFVCVYFWI